MKTLNVDGKDVPIEDLIRDKVRLVSGESWIIPVWDSFRMVGFNYDSHNKFLAVSMNQVADGYYYTTKWKTYKETCDGKVVKIDGKKYKLIGVSDG